ncbi:NADPH-dependent ferric siderophore reductase [Rhodococcus sp. 06-235-1A]|uniref:siderophore-interacting protein n=1 Tax=Rhodococcus sp. 06-235-1A TaxID=2022508 RepID=UPI000B9A1DAB|nr:siderophore-interacting protein [Rhodococcus sp. 06-235-1A]OZC97461.1 NADPH-dependent ferric siderophore reductase [Rhodococcus sp. 06-235-1A]
MAKYLKPEHPAFYRLRVLAAESISPGFVRVTLGGDSLSTFRYMGYDHWFRLFLPQPGQTEPRIPSATSLLWYAQYLTFSKDTKPVVRNYTIRNFRSAGHGVHGDGPEMDVDFVVHGSGARGTTHENGTEHDGHAGPASAWAQKAAPGDRVAIFDEGRIYNPSTEASWQLVVGDESAAPAVLGILRSSPEDLRAVAFIEVASEADIQPQEVPPGVALHWVVRPHPHAKPGDAALAAVQKAELPERAPFVYVAGEQGLATGLRRYLVNDRAVPKSNISFTGYWKFGKAAP